jgi:hypothetical protein
MLRVQGFNAKNAQRIFQQQAFPVSARAMRIGTAVGPQCAVSLSRSSFVHGPKCHPQIVQFARSLATGPAASPTVVSDELLAKLGSLSTQVIQNYLYGLFLFCFFNSFVSINLQHILFPIRAGPHRWLVGVGLAIFLH